MEQLGLTYNCASCILRAKYWYNNYGSILYIITVSKIAFVTSNGSANYTSLEEELASLHGCERVQPVAENDSNDECCCNIISLLKSEDCVVYIIWSGSLDMLNGTLNPRLKGLIRLLSISVDAGSSVMQRLIFLQLGSKGTVDKTVSPLNSIHVFWEVSAEDSSFDAKACGRHVCRLVKERLQGVRVEGEKLQNGPSDDVHYLILNQLGELTKKVDKGREENKEGHKTTHNKIDVLDEKAAEINEINNILTPDQP